MRKIQLTQGKYALVDDEDYDELNKHNWYLKKNYNTCYAIRTKYKTNDKIRMHRIIMNCPKDKIIDHINGDGLDNRKENLRICTMSQNLGNSKLRKDNKSGIKGVYWDKNRNKWIAQIKINYKKKCLGRFDNINEAKLAYEKASKLYHKKFASNGTLKINKKLQKEVNNIKLEKKERLYFNNTSGIKGVSWNNKLKKWYSYIDNNKKRKFLGYFKTKEEAKLIHEKIN